ANVQVMLTNTKTSSVTLSIPVNGTELTERTLRAGETLVYGAYNQPTAATNIGFRNLDIAGVVADVVQTITSGNCQLTWPSNTWEEYLVIWTDDCVTWQNLGGAYRSGPGSMRYWMDTGALGESGQRYYQ